MGGDLQVVFGAGPAGSWTARALRDMGWRVRVVSHSGQRNDVIPADVPVVAADARVPDQARAAADGAQVVYQALGAPYQKWSELLPPMQREVLGAATAVGARYVSIENLYMYGGVDGAIRADSPVNPCSGKGRLRAVMAEELLAAEALGSVQVVILRSSDYYGPGVLTSAFGAHVFEPLVKGRTASLLGRGDQPHSVAYIEDVGRAAATLGTDETAFGQVWLAPHAPAVTQMQLFEAAARASGQEPRARTVGPLLARLVALGNPQLRASVEMLYQFTRPFVVDSTPIEQAFGLTATPLPRGVRKTVEWYRSRSLEPGSSP